MKKTLDNIKFGKLMSYHYNLIGDKTQFYGSETSNSIFRQFRSLKSKTEKILYKYNYELMHNKSKVKFFITIKMKIL